MKFIIWVSLLIFPQSFQILNRILYNREKIFLLSKRWSLEIPRLRFFTAKSFHDFDYELNLKIAAEFARKRSYSIIFEVKRNQSEIKTCS